MLDYKALAKVVDSTTGRSTSTSSQGKTVDEESNPFDKIDLKEKIIDGKTIIIDSKFIRGLAKASRDKRRSFLSKLPDSTRRRVLKELTKIKDSGFSENLGFILLDNLLSTYLNVPSETLSQNIKNFMATQEYTSFSDKIEGLVNSVLEGSTELNEDALEELKSGCGEYPSLVWAYAHPVNNPEENPEGNLDNNPEGNPEGSEVEDSEFEFPEEEDLTDEDITELEDAAKTHISEFMQSNDLKKLIDSIDDLLSEFQGKNRRYSESSSTYWKAFEDAWKENKKKYDEIIDAAIKVVDENALDKFIKTPELDENGNEVKNIESKSVMELLSEALEAYGEGDDTKLQALAKKQIFSEDENPDDDNPDNNPDDSAEGNHEENSDENSEDGNPEGYEEVSEYTDSIKTLIHGILKKQNVNKVVDELKDLVPALSKYNFKISDCEAPYRQLPEKGDAYNIPISIEEYYSTCPVNISPVMEEELQQCTSLPPNPENCSVEGDYINVDGQYYVPYQMSIEEFQQRLDEAEGKNLQEVFSSCKVIPVDSLFRVAAKYDNLPVIDTRFYKPYVVCDGWKFDERPACLVTAPDGNFIKRSTEKDANYHLFGVPFTVLTV